VIRSLNTQTRLGGLREKIVFARLTPSRNASLTRCDKSAVSMRLGRLAKRGLVERDGNGRWRLARANPTMPPPL
jgi:DNA-binding MarR family transcriptional regulator